MTRRIMENLSGLPCEVVRDADSLMRELAGEEDPLAEGKKWLLISRFRGNFLKKCPGTQGFVCCNYSVVNAATGCPLDCTYCILQMYLKNNPMIRVFANTEDLYSELEATFRGAGGRRFRVGTGELTDSLALDPITGFSREIVPFFARQENAILELKTKTDCVENLLDLPHQGKTVIGWSVNPESVIVSDERGASSLEDRLSAAVRCHAAGYRIAFHFDPILFDPGWEDRYHPVVRQVLAGVPAESIAWISLGGVRFPRALKEIMRERFPRSCIRAGEFVPCPDSKFRYLRPVRVPGYRKMVEWIRRAVPQVPIYLCMESREVWEAVFRTLPSRIENLAGIFSLL